MSSDSQDNARKLQIKFKLNACLDVIPSRKSSQTAAWFQAQHMSRFDLKPQSSQLVFADCEKNTRLQALETKT